MTKLTSLSNRLNEDAIAKNIVSTLNTIDKFDIIQKKTDKNKSKNSIYFGNGRGIDYGSIFVKGRQDFIDKSIKSGIALRGSDYKHIIIHNKSLEVKDLENTGGSGGGKDTEQMSELAYAIWFCGIINNYHDGYEIETFRKIIASNKVLGVSMNILEQTYEKMEDDSKWEKSIKAAGELIHSIGLKGNYYVHTNDSSLMTSFKGSFKTVGNSDYNISGDKSFFSGIDVDKWNPSDILISKDLNYDFSAETMDELNHKILHLFETKQLIGISLKKIDERNPIINVYNNKEFDNHTENPSVDKSEKSLDLYLASNGTRMQFRNFAGASKLQYQAEIKGKTANQGKVGLGRIIWFMNKKHYAAHEVAQLVEIKDSTKSVEQLKEQIRETKWFKKNKGFENIMSNQDFTISNAKSMLISITFYEIFTDRDKSALYSDLVRYASSQSDFSSVYYKIT